MSTVDSSNIKTYVTPTATYEVKTKEVSAKAVADLDALVATGALDEDSLITTLAPFPKAFHPVTAGGATIPKPVGTKYARPDFFNIEADVNAVNLRSMQTNAKIENDMSRQELDQRTKILENAAKEKDKKIAAANKRQAAAVGNAWGEIAGGAVGIGGTAMAGKKLANSRTAANEHVGSLKQTDKLKDAKKANSELFKKQNRELDSKIQASDRKQERVTQKAEEKEAQLLHAEAPPRDGQRVAELKMERTNLRREADAHGRTSTRLRAEKEQLNADAVRSDNKFDREITELGYKAEGAEGGKGAAERYTASGRNWTAFSQALPSLLNGITHSRTSLDSQQAEYADAEAGYIATEGQILTMKRESLEKGVGNLASANAATLASCNALEQGRAGLSRDIAQSFKA